MPGTTIVTCLFDLAGRENTSRRTSELYLRLGEFVLALDADLVCFTEPGLAPTIQRRREKYGLVDRTAILNQPFEELRVYPLLDSVSEARRANPLVNGGPLMDTPLYTLLGWSKFDALAAVAQSNPFDAEHFIWLDFGLADRVSTKHFDEDRILSAPPDEIRVLQLRPFEPAAITDLTHHFRYRHQHFATGVISGGREQVQHLDELIWAQAESALETGFAPPAETLLELAIAKEPDLFSPYHGAFPSSLENYRHIRGSGENLEFQLRSYRSAENWIPAANLAAAILESVSAGLFVCESELLARVLEECFIVSFYADESEKRPQARAFASLYADRAHADPDFREAFLRHEIRVRGNLAYVGQVV